DALGGSARENDFVAAASVDKLCRALTCRLEGCGGAIAQFVNAAMNVRIVAFVIISQCVNDCGRLLSSRRVIEVDQRMAVDLLIEDGKVLAEVFPIDLLLLFCQFGDHQYNPS